MLETRLVNKKLKDYQKVISLYNQSFPKEERFSLFELGLFNLSPHVKFEAYYENDTLIGFTYLSFTKKMVFILYLCINPEYRNKGYGTRIINHIKERYPRLTISLNIEPIDKSAPNNDVRIQRKVFYAKNGFFDTNHFIGKKYDYSILCTSHEFDIKEYIKALSKISSFLSRPFIKVRMKEVPKQIQAYIKNKKITKITVGRSGDEVYSIGKKYILKVSSNKAKLNNEKNRVDWFGTKFAGSPIIQYRESENKAFILEGRFNGRTLIDSTYINDPKRLIKVLVKAMNILRQMDKYDCPYQNDESSGENFVHGDLCLPNIIVNDQDDIVAFIDLGDSGKGDKWLDYSFLIWSFEYNVGNSNYRDELCKALNIKFNEKAYRKYTKDLGK